MRKLIGILGLASATLLTACGGGGGSSGNTNERYSITLRADRTSLPLNVGHVGAGIGVNAPYTTTLYVHAKEGNDPIPGGEDIFACNVAGGLNTGALYYLDGDDEHEDDDGNPLAYRSITLGANAGGNSFHFHAGDQAGTATITCSVTDPRDSRVYSASVDITVGAATQLPASVRAVTQFPFFLGTQWNTNDLRNNVGVQAFLMDDANQPVPNPQAANLQIAIRPTGAYQGARLLVDGQAASSVVQVRTTGGVGQFSLSSGPNRGAILLELTTDRYDNNVANGIQDPVTALTVVPVVEAVASEPLSIVPADLTATNGLPYAFALTAEGGLPPYTWSALGGLPTGLSLSSSGVVSGTPRAEPGDYSVAVRVTDDTGDVVTTNLTLTLGGAMPFDPLTFSLSGCSGGDVNTACALPVAQVSQAYLYAFSTAGGDPTQAVTWTFTPATPVPGLTTATAGNTGVISGAPSTDGTYLFVVTATRGAQTVSRQVSLQVNP